MVTESYARDDGYNATGWIETYTGRMVTPLTPNPRTLGITDIAYALANKCRYTGHTAKYYSVAEHCVLMAQYGLYTSTEVARWALLHDAVEAYLPDIPRPLKPGIPGWAEIEGRMERAVLTHFQLTLRASTREAVKDMDTRILLREAETLLVSGGLNWQIPGKPLRVTVEGWEPRRARSRFLTTFNALFRDYFEPDILPWFDATVDHSLTAREAQQWLHPVKTSR